MAWLVIFHICPYSFAALDNLPVMFAYATVWVLQPLYSASVSVDSFFVIRFEFLRDNCI